VFRVHGNRQDQPPTKKTVTDNAANGEIVPERPGRDTRRVPRALEELIGKGSFDQALTVLDGEDASAVGTTLARARVLVLAGRAEAAAELLETALGRADLDAHARAECLVQLAPAYVQRGEGHRVQALVTEALALSDDRRLRGLGLLTLGAYRLRCHEPRAALAHLWQARQALEPEPAEHVRVLDALGACWTALGHAVRARSFLEHAIEKKAALGDRYGLALSHGQLGRLCLRLRELGEAERHFDEDRRHCRAMGNARLEAMCLGHLAEVALLRRDADTAGELLSQASGVEEAQGAAAGLLARARAELHLLRGEIAQAQSQARRAAELLAAEGEHARAIVAGLEGRVALAEGDFSVAEERHARALASAMERDAKFAALEALSDLADVHLARDDPSKLVATLKQALALAEGCRADVWVGLLERRLEDADAEIYLDQLLSKLSGTGGDGVRGSSTPYALRAETRLVGMIFCDLVGFTAWSAKRDATEVVDTLNDYFGRMAVVVTESEGTIDKYIGDGLMVLFEGEDEADLAVRACGCALAMRSELAAWNAERRLLERDTFEMRVGVHVGPAVVGNMGSYAKVARTAIGREVNLAARLEQLCAPGRVLTSARVAELARARFVFGAHVRVEPKGLPPQETAWLEGAR
jgi:adenylate cyclase